MAAGDRSAAPLLHSRRVAPAIPDVLCQSPCGAGAAAGPAHCCHTAGCQTQPVRHQRHKTGTNTVALLAGVSVGAGERRSQNGRCGDPSSWPALIGCSENHWTGPGTKIVRRIDPHIQPAALSDHQYSLDRRDKSQVGCAPGGAQPYGRRTRACGPCGCAVRVAAAGPCGWEFGPCGWELYVRYPSKLRGACGSRSRLSAPISRPFRSSVPVAGRFWFRWPPAGSRCLAISRFPVPGSRFPVPGSRFPEPLQLVPVPLLDSVPRCSPAGNPARAACLAPAFAGWSWFRWPAGSRCLAAGWFRFRWPADRGSGGRPPPGPAVGHPWLGRPVVFISPTDREFRTRDDGSPAPATCGESSAPAGGDAAVNPHVRVSASARAGRTELPGSSFEGTSARQPFLATSASICS